MTEQMQECLQNCRDCHETCLGMVANVCLETGGKHVEPAHMRLMLDCAQICQTAVDFMLRTSSLHSKVCGVCAEICDACAASCEQVGDMKDCVQACRRCAASCHRMAAA